MAITFSNLSLSRLSITRGHDCTVDGPTVNSYSNSIVSANFTGSINYGNGIFSGIGFNNNGPYPSYNVWSEDFGVTWNYNATGVNAEYRIVVFGGDGRWVAVAGNSSPSNKNAISTDGINWNHYSNMPSSNYWYGLGYGQGKFIAGAYASGTLASSTNGITWSPYAAGIPGTDSIAYGNGIWVLAYRNASTMYRSLDGISWSSITPAVTAGSVDYDNGLFLSRVYAVISQFKISTDGLSWSTKNYPALGSWTTPRWNGQIWILWGIVGGVGNFYWSNDLDNWTVLSPSTSTTSPVLGMGNGDYVFYQGSTGSSYVVSC